MQLKGKQIKDSSVQQNKLNVTTESITNVSSVTNADYVNTNSVDRVEAVTYATLNMNMVANSATIGDLACPTPIIEFPISNIQVKVNNISVTVGATADCYFSPDAGTTIRIGGLAQKGDYLYWNSSRFDLETDDEIDFIYLIAKESLELAANSTIILDPYYPALNVKYTGADDTDMTLTIDGVDFVVGNVAGQFVWDIGGANETTITTIGEAILQVVNNQDYTIWFDGFGSLLFSIKKGKFIIEIIYPNFGYGFNSDVTDIYLIDDYYYVTGEIQNYNKVSQTNLTRLNLDGTLDTSFNSGDAGFNNTTKGLIIDPNGKLVVYGYFYTYNGVTQRRILRMDKDGTLDTSFNSGGFGFNGNVLNVITDNNKYIAVGDFTEYNGVTANHIIRLNQDGSIDTSFNSGIGFSSASGHSEVRDITKDSNGKYLVVGDFNSYNGTSINRLIRLNTDGTIDNIFDIGTGFNLNTIGVKEYNGKYIVCGGFTEYNGVNINRIIMLNTDGTIDNSFDVGTGFDNWVVGVYVYNNNIYITGEFSTYNSVACNNVIKLNEFGILDTNFIVNIDGHISNIKEINNNLFLTGYYELISNKKDLTYYKHVNHITLVNPINGKDLSLRDTQPLKFKVRMTIDGNLGNFTPGVYDLIPTYNAYQDFRTDEAWVYDTNNISLVLNLDFEYTTPYYFGQNKFEILNLNVYNGTTKTTSTYNKQQVDTSGTYLYYIVDNVNLFKTYNLGNGVNMTLEYVTV